MMNLNLISYISVTQFCFLDCIQTRCPLRGAVRGLVGKKEYETRPGFSRHADYSEEDQFSILDKVAVESGTDARVFTHQFSL